MSNTATKNIILSQPKVGLSSETPIPTLTHTSSNEDEGTVFSVEIPGVDPSTVNVNFEHNMLVVTCPKGHLSVPINPSTDYSKIKADILWGMLTITIPYPEEPVTQAIKVSVHDTIHKSTHKTTEKKFTKED